MGCRQPHNYTHHRAVRQNSRVTGTPHSHIPSDTYHGDTMATNSHASYHHKSINLSLSHTHTPQGETAINLTGKYLFPLFNKVFNKVFLHTRGSANDHNLTHTHTHTPKGYTVLQPQSRNIALSCHTQSYKHNQNCKSSPPPRPQSSVRGHTDTKTQSQTHTLLTISPSQLTPVEARGSRQARSQPQAPGHLTYYSSGLVSTAPLYLN